jgi:hypothetical protein
MSEIRNDFKTKFECECCVVQSNDTLEFGIQLKHQSQLIGDRGIKVKINVHTSKSDKLRICRRPKHFDLFKGYHLNLAFSLSRNWLPLG